METQPQQRSIADMMKERPGDFDFGDIKDEAAPGKASNGTSATLTQILGGFTYFGTDEVSGMKFYGRKPKLKALDRMAELFNHSDTDETSRPKITDFMAALASHLLYVREEERWRSATVDEIKEAFDIDEVTSATRQFSHQSGAESAEGNE